MSIRFDEADLAVIEANGVTDQTQYLIWEIRQLQDELGIARETVNNNRDEAEDAIVLLDQLRYYLFEIPNRKADQIADDLEAALRKIEGAL